MPFTRPFKQLLSCSVLADYRNCWTKPHWEKDSLQFWNEFFFQIVQLGAWLLPPWLFLSGEMNLNMCQLDPCCIFPASLEWERNFLSFDFTSLPSCIFLGFKDLWYIWKGIWTSPTGETSKLSILLALKATICTDKLKDWFWEQDLASPCCPLNCTFLGQVSLGQNSDRELAKNRKAGYEWVSCPSTPQYYKCSLRKSVLCSRPFMSICMEDLLACVHPP